MERRTPLRAFSAKREAGLRAAGAWPPASSLVRVDPEGLVRAGLRRWPTKAAVRSATIRAARRSGGPSPAAVDAVIDRDGSCVVCGEINGDERGVDWSIQHRKRRSQGGDNRLSNLLLLCGNGTVGCHSKVDGSPINGRRGGWLILGSDEPELVPVAHRLHGWVLLDNRGGFERTDRRPGGDG